MEKIITVCVTVVLVALIVTTAAYNINYSLEYTVRVQSCIEAGGQIINGDCLRS